MNKIYWLINEYRTKVETDLSESEFYWRDMHLSPEQVFQTASYSADINGSWEEYGKYSSKAEALNAWYELEKLTCEGEFLRETVSNQFGKWVVAWDATVFTLERIEVSEDDPDDIEIDCLGELAPEINHTGTHLYVRKLTFKNSKDSFRALGIDDYTGVDERDIYLDDNRDRAEIETLAEFDMDNVDQAEWYFWDEACAEVKQGDPTASDLIIITLEEESRTTDREYVDSTIIYHAFQANK